MKTAKITVQRLKLEDLKPHPRNPRKHPDAKSSEWKALKASLEHDYFDPIVWNKRNGLLVSGHLRTKVLRDSGFSEADCVVVDYDEPTHLARMIAANKLQGEDDEEAIKKLLGELSEADIDMNLTGLDQNELSEILGTIESDDIYTNKIISPIYEPKGKKPAINELIDRSKTLELIKGIEGASIPEDVKTFLQLAAERHTKFHFANIAEFYCHADKETQELMEKSAMIIIDYNKAVENGFVHLTEKLGAIADKEEFDEA